MSQKQTPYVGPSPIQANQPFYGRDSEKNELINRLAAHRIVLLHSPSGAGKTSLIQAGLLPEMDKMGYLIFPRTLVGRQPAAGAVPGNATYNRYILSILMLLDENLPAAEQTPIAKLASMHLLDYLSRRLERLVEQEGPETPGRALLIFDQFEEILTLDPADQAGRLAFFGELMQALYDYRFWALFAMREDYIAGLEPYLAYLPERLSARFRLEFLGPQPALEAIQNPARDFGAEFADEAAGQLVKDLRQVYVQTRQGGIEKRDGPFIEPVQLQVVCANLWAAPRADANKISLVDVQKYGNVDNALGSYYANRVTEAAAAGAVPESSLRFWIDERLITPQGLRRQVLSGPDSEYGVQEPAIRKLADAYILREEQRRGAAWLELAHDRLVEPVRKDNAEWFEQHLSLLQRRAVQWERERRPDDLLLSDQALAEAESWQQEWTGRGLKLNRSEEELLRLSQEARQQLEDDRLAQTKAERQALELQAAEEKAAMQAKAARRQRWLLVGISLLALVVIALLVITLGSLGRTERARVVAETRLAERLAAESTSDAANATIQSERATAVVRLTELFAADATGIAANATSTSLANQSTVVANLRLTGEAATAQAAQLQQLAQVAGEIYQSQASPLPTATLIPEPGQTPGATQPPTATEGPIIPVTGGDGYPYENLLSAADRLKNSQPQLSLLLAAIAYDLSGAAPAVGDSIYRLAGELDPEAYSAAFPLADLGASTVNVGLNPDESILFTNSSPGDILGLAQQAAPLGAIRGLPNAGANTFLDTTGALLALVGPPAQGISISASETDAIAWKETVDSGRTFAILQVSPTSLDKRTSSGAANSFLTNWSEMIGTEKFQDLVRGAYWVFDPAQDPAQQAKAFYSAVTSESILRNRRYGQPGDLPLILQVSKAGGLGRADLGGAVKATLDWLKALSGRTPIIYTSPEFWNTNLVSPSGEAPSWTADYPLWVRDPEARTQPRLPNGWSAWAFWDYQTVNPGDSDRLSMPNIGNKTAYTLSRYNGTLEALEDFANKPNTKQALTDKTVTLWQVNQGQALRQLQLDPNDLVVLAGSPSGEFLFTATANGGILQWNIKALRGSGSAASRPSNATNSVSKLTNGPLKTLLVSYKGSWLAATDPNGAGFINSLVDEIQRVATLDCNKERFRDLEISQAPNERWLAGVTANRVCLWMLEPQRDTNFEAWKILATAKGYATVAFDPSGRYLAAGGSGVPLLVWDLQDPDQAPLSLETPAGEVASLAFSTDAAVLAAGMTDGDLVIWLERAANAPPVRLKGHRGRVNDLLFTAERSLLYSAADDGRLLAWDLAILADPQLLACDLAGRNPTEAELAAFGFDRDMIAQYRTICPMVAK